MPTFRKILMVLIMTLDAISLIGCGDKQTIKTASEKPTAGRVPAPPGE